MAGVAAASKILPKRQGFLTTQRGLHLGGGLLKKQEASPAKCIEKCTKRQLEAKAVLLGLRYLQPSAKQLNWVKFVPAPPKVDFKLDMLLEQACRVKAECGKGGKK